VKLADIDYPCVFPSLQAQAAIDALQAELDPRYGGRPEIKPRDALQVLEYESFLAWVTIQNFLNGEELPDQAIDRLTLACSRIGTISRIATL
jgi:hypothetical protein